MKILIMLLSVILIGYVAAEPYSINRFWHLFFKPTDLYQPILRKDISSMNKLEGDYTFSCKYPQIYEIGIGAKRKVLKSDFNKIKGDRYFFNTKMNIKISSGADVLLAKEVVKPIAYMHFKSDIGYYENIVLTTYGISNCQDLRLQIDVVDGDFGLNDDLFYLYMAVSRIP